MFILETDSRPTERDTMTKTTIQCPNCGNEFRVKQFKQTALCHNCQSDFSVSSSQYL